MKCEMDSSYSSSSLQCMACHFTWKYTGAKAANDNYSRRQKKFT